ncbi:hypothetical protein CP987_10810 [Morganella morganii]|nr:hypothetical protein CP987_10810 [Morganella morganii]
MVRHVMSGWIMARLCQAKKQQIIWQKQLKPQEIHQLILLVATGLQEVRFRMHRCWLIKQVARLKDTQKKSHRYRRVITVMQEKAGYSTRKAL